jgi:methionyl-tRNA synthetase
LDSLTRYDPDALRYYLTVNMPENHDSDWDWKEFIAKNNGELVATWGNLANRVLSFSFKHWEGFVPSFGGERHDLPTLRTADLELLAGIETGFQTVGALLDSVKLRAALQETFRLAATVNQYLDQMAPWQAIKTDRGSAALTIYTALKAIDSLKVLFAPFLPFTCEKLNGFFGYDSPLFGESYTETVTDILGEHAVLRYRPGKNGNSNIWKPSDLKPGTHLNQPAPMFKKLDEVLADEELTRLGKEK